jgi:hypothetical protein
MDGSFGEWEMEYILLDYHDLDIFRRIISWMGDGNDRVLLGKVRLGVGRDKWEAWEGLASHLLTWSSISI